MSALCRATGGRVPLSVISSTTEGRLCASLTYDLGGSSGGTGKSKKYLKLQRNLQIEERDIQEITTILIASGILDE